MDDKLLELLKLSDLPEPYNQIARVIGLDPTKKLIKELGGEMIYFPKMDAILVPVRDKAIREEFTGYNYEELARKYGLTSRWIRQIVEPIEAQVRKKPMDGQLDLFALGL